MKFKDLIIQQTLSPTDEAFAMETCKRWEEFSNTMGKMNKAETLKMLKYLMVHRPNSKTLGNRAIQRFNSLNKVRWSDLTNGGDDGDGETS